MREVKPASGDAGVRRSEGTATSSRALGEGAAQAAPTAPHATPRPPGGRPNGPERFWRRRLPLALGVCAALSVAVHGALVPWELPHLQVNDVQGEVDIPLDVLSGEPAPPPPPAAPPSQPPPAEPSAAAEPPEPSPLPVRHDARDAAAADARIDAADAASDAGPAVDAALLARADDAGTGGQPRTPEAVIGAVGSVQADTVNVMLLVNTDVIREHPVGAHLGEFLRQIPQWQDFLAGSDLDVVRDTDWILISGPALRNSSRVAVSIRYPIPDAAVDRWLDSVGRRSPHGGRIDAGVPSVRAWQVHLDRADRVVLRAHPHLIAFIPPDVAPRLARTLSSARVPERVRPGEALYLRLVDPHHALPDLPAQLTELRLRVVPQLDGAVDLFAEGDTADDASAAEAAQGIRRLVRRLNGTFVELLTHGVLDGAEVFNDGRLVKAHLHASLDQVEAVAALAGVLPPTPAGSDTAPTAPPPAPTTRAPSNAWPPR